MGDLVNLKRLFLDENILSGEIPPELGNLGDSFLIWDTTLSLKINGNRLSGCVPISPDKLSGGDTNLGTVPLC